MNLNLRQALLVAGNQLQRLLHGGKSLALLLLMPLALNFVLGASLQRTFSPGAALPEPVQIAVVPGTAPQAPDFLAALQDASLADVVAVETVAQPAVAVAAVRQRDVQAAILLPEDFPQGEVRIVGEPFTLPTGAAEDLAQQIGGALTGAAASKIPVAMELTRWDESSPARSGGALDYYAVGMAVFMLFFAAADSMVGLADDRAGGAYFRNRASGVSRQTFLLGKWLGAVATSWAYLLIMRGATRLLFGTQWGSWGPWLLLSLAGAATVTGIALVLLAVIRTRETFYAVGPPLFVIMAFLGGSMLPAFQMPGAIDRISHWLPTRVLLDSYLQLQAGQSWAQISPAVTFLAITATGFLLLGWLVEALTARRTGEA